MTNAERTKQQIETLKESLAIDWQDYMKAETADERSAIQKHLEWCSGELVELMAKVEGRNA